MKLVLIQRDTGLVNRLAPTLAMALSVLASIVPLPLPGFAVVTPAFALMAVYHWTIYRPDLLPYAVVFGAGVLLDLLKGGPLGVTSMVLLLGRAGVLSQRRLFAGRSFAVVWAGFVAVTAAATALEWLLVSALYRLMLDVQPFLFQAVLTISTYPVASYLFVRLQRSLLART